MNTQRERISFNGLAVVAAIVALIAVLVAVALAFDALLLLVGGVIVLCVTAVALARVGVSLFSRWADAKVKIDSARYDFLQNMAAKGLLPSSGEYIWRSRLEAPATPQKQLASPGSQIILNPNALRESAVIVLPFFEKQGEKYYNSAAVIDCGKVLGVYRKLHLPNIPFYKEPFYFSPGNTGFPVVETSRGRTGVQICWDNLFPEGTRVLALKSADIVFAPTAASVESHTLWERAVSANAFANNLFVFRVNRVGQEDGIAFYGRSFCAGPWGEMVSELAGSKDAIVIADIDLKDRDAAAETWGFLPWL